MKLITKNTDYALRALIELAEQNEGYISVREISLRQNVPYQYLRKIFQELIHKGIVKSKEGGKGGVRLIKKSNKIKVIDIINVFQGQLQLSECLFRGKLCENRTHCVLRQKIKEAEKLVEKFFKGVTIQTLIEDKKRR